MSEKINLAEKFSKFTELWTPKIIAESNGQLVKLAKGTGELEWHKHDNEDELFIVFKGCLTLQLREENIVLKEGEMYVVPKGVEHCPLAEPDTHFLMVEPATTQQLGADGVERAVSLEQQEYI